MSYERDWPEQARPFYRITVREDGSGSLTTARQPTPEQVVQIHVSEATRAKLFAVEGVLASGKECETGSKHTALTGRKVLTLRRGSRVLRCTFNYSDDRRLQDAVTALSAIDVTVAEAPKLEHLHRFDRLGLDAEVASFTDAVKGGRAIELGNIAAILRTLAGDGELLERVRNRAADLLSMAEAGK